MIQRRAASKTGDLSTIGGVYREAVLKLIGAGLPRTATTSLQAALPTLLGGDCYHMSRVFANPDHPATWVAALRGDPIDWDEFFTGYTAAVDWPASAMWPELAAHYPDAVILLSTRSSAQAWYRSMNDTILPARRAAVTAAAPSLPPAHGEMFERLWGRILDCDPDDRQACERAYDAYVQRVRHTAPADRLVEWDASKGWEPLCRALDVPVPETDFPHLNTTEEFGRLAERIAEMDSVTEFNAAASGHMRN